jgi:TatA/E family protein of Tat protein translocase
MEGFLGIGGNELIIILIFAFLIFGPDKLPDIARTIGRAIAKFRDAQNEVNEVIRQEVYDPATDKDNPLQKAAEKAADLNKPQQPKTETFAERKARYDKIRAERKAKEDAAKAAAEAAGNADAATPAEQTAPAAEADAEPTYEDLDAMLGVSPSKPAPSSAPAQGGDA